MTKWIKILNTGTFTAKNGKEVTFHKKGIGNGMNTRVQTNREQKKETRIVFIQAGIFHMHDQSERR